MSRNQHALSAAVVTQLTLDTEPWLSCDECFEHVDEYVELLLADPAADMPAMRVHLRACAACAEEASTLLVLAAADNDVDPEPLLRRMNGATA